MPARNINFSNENDLWIVSNGKPNLSAFVNLVLDNQRLGKTLVSVQDIKEIKQYISQKSFSNPNLSLQSVIHEALKLYFGQNQSYSYYLKNQSNTGLEQQTET